MSNKSGMEIFASIFIRVERRATPDELTGLSLFLHDAQLYILKTGISWYLQY